MIKIKIFIFAMLVFIVMPFAEAEVLQPAEYDIDYFDGKLSGTTHPAGYSKYEKWNRNEGINSLGEYWADKAAELVVTYSLAGKKILEIGCAKGFMVEALRNMGVDAYGLDVSGYAIGESDIAVMPYLTEADARTYLVNYGRNEFDVLFSLRTMECFADADIPDLVSEMNRISRFQVHVIDEQPNPLYYNVKTLNDWLLYGWTNNKTVLVSHETKIELRK